jgi:hypothetical protein
MTDPDPTTPAAPAPSPAADPAPAAPTPAPSPSFASFHPASRLIIGGAAVLGVAILIGVVVGTWRLDPFGFVVLVLAILAAGAAWSVEAMTIAPSLRPWQPVTQLAAGAAATALSGLAVVEMIGDLDDIEEFGGIIGLVLGVVVLAASVAILWGALQRTSPDLRGAARGAQVAALGAGLVLLAWVLHLTIGFWAFAPATWGLLAVVLAAVLLLTAGEAKTPAWVSWVAVGLGVFAAWVALGQWGALMDIGERQLELGLEEYLPFLIYAAGILLVIGGGVLSATGGRLAIPGAGPDATVGPDAAA